MNKDFRLFLIYLVLISAICLIISLLVLSISTKESCNSEIDNQYRHIEEEIIYQDHIHLICTNPEPPNIETCKEWKSLVGQSKMREAVYRDYLYIVSKNCANSFHI